MRWLWIGSGLIWAAIAAAWLSSSGARVDLAFDSPGLIRVTVTNQKIPGVDLIQTQCFRDFGGGFWSPSVCPDEENPPKPAATLGMVGDSVEWYSIDGHCIGNCPDWANGDK